jgi:hypothetical protein
MRQRQDIKNQIKTTQNKPKKINRGQGGDGLRLKKKKKRMQGKKEKNHQFEVKI